MEKNTNETARPKNKYKTAFFITLALCFILAIPSSDADNVNSLTETNNELSKETEQLSAKISSLESELDDYKLQITSLTNDKKSLNDELDKLKQDNLKLEEQQSEIDKLNTLINELEKKNSDLEAENESSSSNTNADVSNLQDVKDNNNAVSTAAAESSQEDKSEPIDEPVAVTVYWVSGGKVYHSTSSCSTLKRSSNIQSGTITQSGKSRACKVCY